MTQAVNRWRAGQWVQLGLFICCFATVGIVQHLVVLDLPIDAICPQVIVLPILLGAACGYIVVRLQRSRSALDSAEGRYRLLFEHSNDAVFLHRDGRLIEVNDRACEMTGYNRAEMIGMRVLDLSPASTRDAATQAGAEMATTGAVQFESQFQRKDGSIIDVEISARFVDRYTETTQGIVRDITTRKLAEAELQQSRALYAGLVETSRNLIFRCDIEGRFTYLNSAWSESTGYSLDEMLGQRFEELKRPEVAKREAKIFEQVLEGGQIEAFETTCLTKDGEERTLLFNAGPMRDAGGSIVGTQGTAVDISERKLLEQKLLQAQKMEAVGTLAGGIAHDMNNVLSVVLSYGSVILSESKAGDPVRDDVQEIVTAARRGKTLVENLLGYARKGDYRKVTTNLNDLVEQMAEVLRHTIPKRIVVKTDLGAELAKVECDPAQLNQVLMNLCVNASQAIEGAGNISISTQTVSLGEDEIAGVPVGRYVRLDIQDDGVGMDDATLRHAFEPFFTTKDVGEGTGLGLSMVYGAIENHGGHVSIASVEGEGTMVTLVLPATDAVEAAVGNMTSPQRKQPVTRGEVLLVDDDDLVCRSGKRLLESIGYEVIIADGGQSAVELYREAHDRIDFVLLDLSMPLMDGAECFGLLQEIDADVRVLICTGHSRSEITESMMAKGALGVVNKPFDVQGLSDAIALAEGEGQSS